MEASEGTTRDVPPSGQTGQSPSRTRTSTVISVGRVNEDSSSTLLKEAICLLLEVFYGILLFFKQICVNSFFYIVHQIPFLKQLLHRGLECVANRARDVPIVNTMDRSLWKLFARTISRICPEAPSRRRHCLVFSMGFILGTFIYVSTLNISYALHYEGRRLRIATTFPPIYQTTMAGYMLGGQTTLRGQDTTAGLVLGAKVVKHSLDYGRPSYRGSQGAPGGGSPSDTEGREPPEDMPRIPHIIHQNWHTKLIPQLFSSWILSWRRNHPKWRHIFWTGRGGQQLVQRAFPEYKSLYLNYSSELHRFKVDRFFVLYHFGGIFADLDVESLRPLDKLIDRYSCVLTEQPLIHQALLFDQKSPNYVVTSFMACTPRHPFLKFVLEMLETYQPYDSNIEPSIERIEKSVGSLFLGDVLQLYKIAFNRTVAEEVHILPPDWLMPNYNENHRGAIAIKCQSGTAVSAVQQKLCGSLLRTDFSNVIGRSAFNLCHWINLYTRETQEYIASNPVVSIEKLKS